MTGDAERFSLVYDECRQRVWAYVVSRAGRQAADEVVNETFLVAWRRLPDLPDDPLPWLLGVARNVLRASVRAEVRRESFAREVERWTETTERDLADDVADRLGLLRALGTLTESDREALVLAAWHGLSTPDIARVVGCTPTTMRVRLHRARRRLTQALEESNPPSAAPVQRWLRPTGKEMV